MTSNIDATKPADGATAVKADMRSNFAAAKSEIEGLQDLTSGLDYFALRGFRNRIINGDFTINQRNGTSGVTPATSGYVVDRWRAIIGAASKLTFQSSDTDLTLVPGSSTEYAIGVCSITVASQYTPAAGEAFYMEQPIEGFNFIDFLGRTCCVSFIARSPIVGTYGACLRVGSRYYPFTYNIAIANTLTLVLVNIPADVFATGPVNDNNNAAAVIFDLGSGANFVGSGTAGFPNNGWTGSVFYRPTGTVQLVSQVAGTKLEIRRVMLMRGNPIAAPVPELRSRAEEYILCQRYYERVQGTGGGYGAAANAPAFTPMHFKVSKRATPTLSRITVGTEANLAATYPQINSITTGSAAFMTQSAAAGPFYSYGNIYAVDAELP